MTAQPMPASSLLEVLANIDQGTKRWRRKCQLIAVLGRWGEVHELGVRELSERTAISHRLLAELLGELLEAQVLQVAYVGQGSRATAWVVDGRLQRWRGVPWLRDPAAVALYAFHVTHEDYAEPGQRAQGEPGSARRAPRRAQGEPGSARRPERRAQGEPGSARRGTTARGIRAGLRAQIDAGAQEGFPTRSPDDSAAARPGAGAGLDPAEWRQLRAAVIAAAAALPGRAKFLNGPAEVALSELALVAGCSEVQGWLLEAPTDLGVPRLVDWLQDRWHQPSSELLEQLAARAEAQGAGDAPPEPPRRHLPEVRAPEPTAMPERRPGAAAAARAALGQPPDTTRRQMPWQRATDPTKEGTTTP